ncbi:hypothetical protein GCM10023085_53440 [Actinomadura viridis]|uniref:Uncharacterized protein n=1 Tax=Actinomadura viridis TaxID=58110 RepID=A0A931DEY8_9ACTN|nr:hypothetical protein [Actinomadura viridis]MBG6086311.1 hypothetical protein [Actinomadura viridis]
MARAGGGGNFGAATSLTFHLYSLPAVTVGILLWPPEAGPEVVRAYRDFTATAPGEVGGAAVSNARIRSRTSSTVIPPPSHVQGRDLRRR